MMEALMLEHRQVGLVESTSCVCASDGSRFQERPKCRVKMTTVHPFTVDTGLAHNPTTRFPRLLPIVTAAECARTALEAARRDEDEVFVPRALGFPMRLGRCFPRRAQMLAQDFLGVGVGHNEK